MLQLLIGAHFQLLRSSLLRTEVMLLHLIMWSFDFFRLIRLIFSTSLFLLTSLCNLLINFFLDQRIDQFFICWIQRHVELAIFCEEGSVRGGGHPFLKNCPVILPESVFYLSSTTYYELGVDSILTFSSI